VQPEAFVKQIQRGFEEFDLCYRREIERPCR